MSGLMEDAIRLFGSDNLYTLLNCDKFCDQNELKQAFYKSSLKYHPDRHPDEKKRIATEQFQVLSKAFAVLSDKDSRAMYDERGTVGESFSEKSFKDWVDYWSLIFPRITEESINELKKEYVGSEEEKDDVAKYYEQYKGDMDRIMEAIMFAEASNEERYREIILEMIESKRLIAYDAFTKETSRKRSNRFKRGKKEAREAEEISKKRNKENDSMESLVLALRANQEKRRADSEKLLDNLTANYQKPGSKERKKTAKRQR